MKELGELAEKAPAAWDKGLALSTLARVLLATGGAKDARGKADEALAVAPFSGWAHLASGLVAARQKDDAKAREELIRAVELEPAHGGARLALGDALSRGGDEDQNRAVAEYSAFLKIGGSDSDETRVKRILPTLKKKLAQR